MSQQDITLEELGVAEALAAAARALEVWTDIVNKEAYRMPRESGTYADKRKDAGVIRNAAMLHGAIYAAQGALDNLLVLGNTSEDRIARHAWDMRNEERATRRRRRNDLALVAEPDTHDPEDRPEVWGGADPLNT